LAHDPPKPAPPLPAHVTSAVVRVDAYEHETLGVVIGDGHLVLVPFGAIEVARPGFPHAFVTDSDGVRHDAGLAATDRAAGLALLAVEQPITATPLALSPHRMTDDVDLFAIPRAAASGRIDDGAWSFYPAGSLDAHGDIRPSCPHMPFNPWPPAPGSPVIDVDGRLVAIMGDGIFLSPHPIELTPANVERLDGSERTRRSLIFYGGMTLPFSFALEGGLWFGLGAEFSARVHDVVELRLDATFTVLVPVKSPPPDACGSSCYAGIRGVATPSIGYRQVVGGFGGKRAWPIALTPSVGVAFGVQDTSRDHGATAYDAAVPSTWAKVAPGLTLSVPFGEVRSGVRIPLDRTGAPEIELGIGFVF
jgi:hypothetical protein